MDFSQVFVDAHKQHRLADLVPLNEELYVKYKGDDCSYEEWQKSVQQFGYKLTNFYVDAEHESFMDRFFYVGEYATVSYPTIALEWLAIDLNADQMKRNQLFKELFESGNYALYFFPENNSFAIDYFIRHFGKIPNHEKYEVFKNLYVFLETGFDLFPNEIMATVLGLAPRKKAQERLMKQGEVTNGVVTVYRGMMEHSTPLENALSWTLSRGKAEMFASRDRKFGEVYKGVVELERIIDYLPDGNEEEVWIEYGAVEKIEKMADRQG